MFSHTTKLIGAASAVAFTFTLGVAAEPAKKAPSSGGGAINLKLSDYIQTVMRRNETIQGQILGAEASRRKYRAEFGVFEPELVGSAQRVRNKRPNTVEQRRNLQGVEVLDETNNLYDVGLETLVPTGAKIRLGYTLSDLNNNLRAPGDTTADTIANPTGHTHEYQSFVGATLTQPLLKNAGWGATLANIRLAALDSDAAFQDYRRQLMVTLSQAESAYWNLYLAQEQVRFLGESVALAETIRKDASEKAKAGKGAELDVLEAESGLALRRTKQNEAQQKYAEAVGQVLTYAGTPPAPGDNRIHAADRPASGGVPLSYHDSCRTAFDLNPDYQIQKSKVEEAGLKVGVAKNQALPEFNLKGSYGFNGLGDSPSQAWDDQQSQDFPSWSFGVEFRIPITGGVRGRNETAAARLAYQQSQLALHGLGSQLSNAINNAISKVQTSRASVRDYETTVNFNENLLKTQIARLEAGKIEARRVLEVEAQLFEARQSLAEARVQYERALIELSLAEGSILKHRNVELTRNELRTKTKAMLKDKQLVIDESPVPVQKDFQFAPARCVLRD